MLDYKLEQRSRVCVVEESDVDRMHMIMYICKVKQSSNKVD